MKKMSRIHTIAVWSLMLSVSFLLFISFGPLVVADAQSASPLAGMAASGGMGILFLGLVDMFATRTMIQALEKMHTPNTALLDLFAKGKNVFTTETVDIDIVKNKRKMAPFVSPVVQGKVVERAGMETRSIKPPYVKPKMVTTAGDFLKRQPGEIIYQGNSDPATRAQMQLGKDLLYLRNLITRREEWMLAQALTTGKVRCTGEGIDMEIDFQMSANHKVTLTGQSLWSDPDSDPIANNAEWRRLLAHDSGYPGDVEIMGTNALNAFLNNANVQKKLDKTKIALGQINVQSMPQGLTYYGMVDQVDIYSYDEWWVNDADGLSYPMIPENMIVMGSRRARVERLYGAIKDLQATAAVDVFVKSWEEEDPSARILLAQSAPIPAPLDIDAFMFAEVI